MPKILKRVGKIIKTVKISVMKKLSLFLVTLTIAMVSCEPQIETPDHECPTVVTKSVTEITETTAKVVGQVADDGGAEVTERGVCWNTDGAPTILDYSAKDAEVGLGTFTSNLSDLKANTTYYVRAYATNAVGTSYGEEKSFTTKEKETTDDPEKPNGVLSCAEALAICKATGTTSTTETYTIRGYVTEFKETFNTQYGNVTYWMADNQGGGKVLLAYRVKPVKTSDKAVKVNDYVEVVGTLVNYMGNTPEVNAGGTYTVITAGNGETPDTPDTPDNPSTPKYEWVDLGLSVKWATCNVGASSPEEYGNYYAWGETETKDYYSNETMTFRLNISELKSRGYIDSEGNLTSSYDAATANWGKEWRMPTRDEVKELIEKGIWTWQYLNGVKGYKVTGPSGNSIFLPPAGYRGWDWSEDVGSDGGYWSSTASEIKNVYGEISHDGSLLSFGDDYYHISSHFRYYGRSVRPVLK